MRLTDLSPRFLRNLGGGHWLSENVSRAEADGVMFWCPVCVGPASHRVLCWQPHVPQDVLPRGGRWTIEGASFEELTLVAPSSSVLVHCLGDAHFFVRSGEVIPC